MAVKLGNVMLSVTVLLVFILVNPVRTESEELDIGTRCFKDCFRTGYSADSGLEHEAMAVYIASKTVEIMALPLPIQSIQLLLTLGDKKAFGEPQKFLVVVHLSDKRTPEDLSEPSKIDLFQRKILHSEILEAICRLLEISLNLCKSIFDGGKRSEILEENEGMTVVQKRKGILLGMLWSASDQIPYPLSEALCLWKPNQSGTGNLVGVWQTGNSAVLSGIASHWPQLLENENHGTLSKWLKLRRINRNISTANWKVFEWSLSVERSLNGESQRIMFSESAFFSNVTSDDKHSLHSKVKTDETESERSENNVDGVGGAKITDTCSGSFLEGAENESTGGASEMDGRTGSDVFGVQKFRNAEKESHLCNRADYLVQRFKSSAWKVVVVSRCLIGRGQHRELHTNLTISRKLTQEAQLLEAGNGESVELALIEFLPAEIFVDPYEVHRLRSE